MKKFENITYPPAQEKLQAEREAFERRMSVEANKLGVPTADLIEDYAREEHAAREANPEEPSTIYETGAGNKSMERQIKETIIAKVIAGRDTLTGINNRVSFDQQAERRRQEVKDRGEFSMIMIDIDKFKNVNDTYGHQAGDYVLQEVAKALKENMRQGDLLARYGGEEMVVIAPNANGSAPGFAERLRKIIENKKFVYNNQEIKVTISAGVSPYNEDFGKMKKVSDTGLYLAKGEPLKLQEGEVAPKVESGHKDDPTRNQVWYFDKKDNMFKKKHKK